MDLSLFDPIASGWLTLHELGYLFGLAGVICGAALVYAMLSNL